MESAILEIKPAAYPSPIHPYPPPARLLLPLRYFIPTSVCK